MRMDIVWPSPDHDSKILNQEKNKLKNWKSLKRIKVNLKNLIWKK